MIAIREMKTAEATSIQDLALSEIATSNYANAPRSALDAAIARSDPDIRALVAVDDAQVVGIIIYGRIAGSEGAGRIQLIVTDPRVRRTGIATALTGAAIGILKREDARFAIVELPADPALSPSRSLFDHCGFNVESRVRDFFRDGVDLLLLRRDLPPG